MFYLSIPPGESKGKQSDGCGILPADKYLDK